MVVTQDIRREHDMGRRRRWPRAFAHLGWIVVPVLVFAVFVWGGYAMHWRWTGLSESVTLWDWLQVLALPVAIGIAPVLLRHHRHLSRGHRMMLAAALILFAALVLAGYLLPMPWTGFTGNTLWDWLELILLPLVVATSSLWAEPDSDERASAKRLASAYLAAGALAIVVFVGVVAAGYLVPMPWTGFWGNTVWDWIKLLLLPVLVPAVIIPLVSKRVSHRLVPAETAPARDNAASA
jgi:hypothetical protein